jgi:Ca-activated chloride channel family protein
MPSLASLFHPPAPNPESTGGRLVSVEGRALPLTGATLKADAKGGVVRVTLEQTFRNPYAEPLRVTYTLPLPADGAVSGFAFRVGAERVIGEVDTKRRARQRFEDAILDGRTAALIDQERSSVFTQEVGNVPPRAEVVCEVQVDQKLAWMGDGAWEWRFPTVVAPRYLGATGRVADAARVSVDVADEVLPVKLGLSLSIRDRLTDGARPESPSHPLHSGKGLGRVDVTFGDERGVALDRDVVVRWRVAGLTVGAELDVARPTRPAIADSAYGLLTLVPPSAAAHMAAVPRDLIVLLDTSGSMAGAPLDQARRVTAALVDSLSDQDQLELIEFSSSPRRWKRGPVPATATNRRDAQGWLARLQASGSTEMRTGILEALAPLRGEAQRQVVLITDGLIGFEDEVLAEIGLRLPRGARVHTVGVGSGVNRSLTQPAARAGRGLECVLGLGEDVEPHVKRLLARTATPLVTNLEVTGTALMGVAPQRGPDLYAGAPALLSLKLRPEGGSVVVRGDTAQGPLVETLHVSPVERGAGSHALAALFAREAVEDLELARATGDDGAALDTQIERVGLDFQIATRLTSWVAVSPQTTVDRRAPRREESMPQMLAYGLSAEGVGLRSSGAPDGLMRPAPALAKLHASAAPTPARAGGFVPRARMAAPLAPTGARHSPSAPEDMESLLMADEEERAPAPAPARASTDRSGLRGLIADVADRLTGKGPSGGATASPPAEAPALPVRELRAKTMRRRSGRLLIELPLTDGPITWTPAHEAIIELADGTMVKAALLTEHTTAEGPLDQGLVLVLALTFDDAHGAPARIHLACGGQMLDIAL